MKMITIEGFTNITTTDDIREMLAPAKGDKITVNAWRGWVDKTTPYRNGYCLGTTRIVRFHDNDDDTYTYMWETESPKAGDIGPREEVTFTATVKWVKVTNGRTYVGIIRPKF